MNEPEVFPHAPATEVILDIRVMPDGSLSVSKLQELHHGIKDRFPHSQSLAGFQGEFRIDSEGASTQASVRQTGFLYRSDDEHTVVQATLEGFTLNKLPPYDRWSALRDEAKELWQRYRDLTHPESVIRVALRYINRIELPLPLKDFREYVLTAPEVAPGMPQALANFYMHLEIPYPDQQATALINLSRVHSSIDVAEVRLFGRL